MRAPVWLSVVVLILIFAQGAVAQMIAGSRESDIGIMAGVAFLNRGGGSDFTWGLRGDHALNSYFKFGGEFNTLQPSSTLVGGALYTNTLTNVDATLKWVPGGFFTGLKLGVLAGAAFNSSNAPGTSSEVNFIYGLTGTYDFSVSGRWTAGPEVEIMRGTGEPSYDEVNLLASLRYWF